MSNLSNMANQGFSVISTDGPGAFRVETNINPSNFLFVPFTYTFSNTANGFYDTGARLPSGAHVISTMITKGSTPLSNGSVEIISTITAGSASRVKYLITATTSTAINEGELSHGSFTVSTDVNVTIQTTLGPIVSGQLKGKIFYTNPTV
jgi:hypothetical protein